MSRRAEFTKPTKREALRRAGGHCEATGGLYGLSAAQRCNAPLSYGVEFDHVDCDANSKNNSLENCAAVCIRCHSWKTRHVDIPKAAKTLRQQDKMNGIARAKRPFPGSRASGWKRPMHGPAVRRT